jgi:5'(3')-deoxyribonucleotidase
MFKQLFLDMDGVIVDFDGGVRKRYGVDWYPTEWAIPYKEFGTDFKTFWSNLDTASFWNKLDWMPDGKRIQTIVEPMRPIILTAAVMPFAAAGKQMWLKREYPDIYKDKRFIIAGGHETKAAVAGPGKILIDDKNENIDEWEKNGGMGILYPRPWNRNADHPYPLEYLIGMLMHHMGGK